MKLAAFDIEIAKQLPAGCENWLEHAPLGITCAAIAYRDAAGTLVTTVHYTDTQFWATDAVSFLAHLYQLREEGYTLLSWNGCGFDLQVLAQESGFYHLCGDLALKHVDLMLEVFCRQGHYLALDKALAGAGLKSKLHDVTLKDGTAVNDMSGAAAPQLWAAGEHEAVLAYLRRDVEGLLELAEWVLANGCIQWTSTSGKRQQVPVLKLSPVAQLFALPEPDTSWMQNPKPRTQFTAWIPMGVKL
jgi:hypothetical protein